MSVGWRFGVVSLSIVTAVAFVGHAGQDPQGVSPGAGDWIVEIAGRCPAFTWEASPEAQLIELIAYRLPESVEVSTFRDAVLTEEDEVLYARLPGGASAWTPPLHQCLEAGESFVWFVRAILHEEAGEVFEAGEWSSAKYFAVSTVPTAMEVEEALDVLRRYAGSDEAGAAEATQARHDTRRQQPARSHSTLANERKAIAAATAAIRGRPSATTGEVYGVVGISDSPTGAGLGAANMNGGADLILDGDADGAVDTLLSESGIERASASAQTFTIDNPSGAMTLQVNGTLSGSALTCPGCVSATELANDAVTAAKIGANQVGASEIAANAVGTSEIADDSIWWRDLRDPYAVFVECNGNCNDSNLGQICSHIGFPGKPIAVNCNNTQEWSSSDNCGGNNVCVAGTFYSGWNLGDICDDGSGWDVIVFCIRDG